MVKIHAELCRTFLYFVVEVPFWRCYYILTMEPVTDQMMANARSDTVSEIAEALASKGIDLEYLTRKLKSELNAKETRFIKIKKHGKVDDVINQIVKLQGGEAKEKKRGVKVIEETTEEVLLAVNVRAWGVQQRAREDAQKLLDLYPAQKQKVEHDMTDKLFATFVKLLPEEHQSYFVGLVKKIKEGK